MKIKELIIKAMRISLIPSNEWKVIRIEQETPKELMWNFAFPIILFSAVGRDIGLFFVAKAVLGYSLNLAILLLFNLISWVAIPYILILAAAYMLNFTLPKLGIDTDYLRILKLVVYTFTPLFIVTFFVYLHPLLRILIPIGIYVFIAYTFYIFWYGIQEMFDITLEKKLRFILITIAVGFVMIFMAQHIYGLMLGWVMPGMEAYVK
ncbi:MAG: Yip1 family protein [Bacteroidales bacterium]|nr:Yip1 family protein [Bacteroidales bacterium]